VSDRQRTLARSFEVEGHGLHTGEAVTASLHPAAQDSGIRFRRTDLAGRPEIEASVEAVRNVDWGTSLGDGETEVRTVEHVLAAVVAHQIDNVRIDLSAPEPPALDGSARPWCEGIRGAGPRELDAAPRSLRLGAPLQIEVGDSKYSILPHDGYRVSSRIDFDHPFIGRQAASFAIEPEEFAREVAPARTFGLAAWKEKLNAQGLALGASRQNTLVLSEEGLEPDCELRYPDEFVRHKILDIIGDLALVGGRLQCHVVAERPGHRGNIEVARQLARLARSENTRLEINEILGHLPHRYPMLLVDRIVHFEEGKRIVGIKNVTINEPFFAGHFPGHPIMPGVLIVESLGQCGGLLLMNEFENPEDKIVYFMTLDDVKFRKPVVPGDQLRLELELLQFRGRRCKMKGVALVEDKVVAEATMLAQVADR